jgi:hypothetical protein
METEKVVFDLKIDGDYSKIKVAKKIILAANHAVDIGCRLSTWQWGITWDTKKKYFRTSYVENDFTWGTILASVILYSNYKSQKSREKTKVAAEILGVDHSWIQGFINGIDNRYDSIVNGICKRKSMKAQQCRDGLEIGKLLKFGYLTEEIVKSTYQPYDKLNYETHNWIDIEQNNILFSMGVNQKYKILQCKKCDMYGSHINNNAQSYPYNTDSSFYISKTLIGKKYYKRGDVFNCNCDETIIKNILE